VLKPWGQGPGWNEGWGNIKRTAIADGWVVRCCALAASLMVKGSGVEGAAVPVLPWGFQSQYLPHWPARATRWEVELTAATRKWTTTASP
jgi:hypothetical protein